MTNLNSACEQSFGIISFIRNSFEENTSTVHTVIKPNFAAFFVFGGTPASFSKKCSRL
jgi:hypothetical protein